MVGPTSHSKRFRASLKEYSLDSGSCHVVEVYHQTFFAFFCGVLDSLPKQSESVAIGFFRCHDHVHFITSVDDFAPVDASDSVRVEDD